MSEEIFQILPSNVEGQLRVDSQWLYNNLSCMNKRTHIGNIDLTAGTSGTTMAHAAHVWRTMARMETPRHATATRATVASTAASGPNKPRLRLTVLSLALIPIIEDGNLSPPTSRT